MGYRTQSSDTSVESERAQFAIFAQMTAAEKVERIRHLSRAANQLALVGLRRRFPEESEARLRRRLVAMRLGPATPNRLLP